MIASSRHASAIRPLSEEVHLWKAFLAVERSQLTAFERSLSHDERARAARFCFKEHHDLFVAARGILRTILSVYLDEDPARLRFRYGVHGKPALEPSTRREADLRFNLSHSAGLLLVAVSARKEVGVDLEHIQPALVNERIVEEVFSEQEQACLYAATAALRPHMFFEGWTRKEAYLKALGVGLSVPLNRVEVLPALGRVLPVCFQADEMDGPHWYMHPLAVKEGYSACLVVEGEQCTIESFDFSAEVVTSGKPLKASLHGAVCEAEPRG
jgi:4'-phosphopantetheinyl transferase